MKANRVLVDTGPLVALLSINDAAHDICADAAQSLPLPLGTTWVVLAEAAWLLRNTAGGIERLLRLLDEGVIECPELDRQAPAWMADCTTKYSDLRPQLADVSLLYLAERDDIATIFTLDRRDFSVYRTRRGDAYILVPERIQ